MSDNWIILIPKDPRFLPEKERIDEAVVIFNSAVPNAEETVTHIEEKIRFFDCGANFEKVICPSCSGAIEIDWWQERMDEDCEDAFDLEEYSLPCCGIKKNLNDLIYDWPQGFARFGLEAMNPEIPEFPKEKISELEEVLGCEIRQIQQHL